MHYESDGRCKKKNIFSFLIWQLDFCKYRHIIQKIMNCDVSSSYLGETNSHC